MKNNKFEGVLPKGGVCIVSSSYFFLLSESVETSVPVLTKPFKHGSVLVM